LCLTVFIIIRETKLVNRAVKHIQKTAQKLEDEDAFLSSTFNQLADDISEYERRAARSHLALNDTCIENTIQLQEVAKKENEVRQEEDVLVLDTVIETQKLLQQTVTRQRIHIEKRFFLNYFFLCLLFR
jgi:hypothetical protein